MELQDIYGQTQPATFKLTRNQWQPGNQMAFHGD